MLITDIAPQKRRPNRFSVFVDGAFTFGMSGEDIILHHLEINNEISQERLDFLMEEVVFVRARDTALRYLVRPRSYREVEKRLEEEDFPEQTVARVMALLVKYKYVDDAQFARDYAESRQRSGHYGLRRVQWELKQKGIDEQWIAEALPEDPEQGELAAARDWLRRKRLDPQNMDFAAKKRCRDALLRRGFTYETIKEALKNE